MHRLSGISGSMAAYLVKSYNVRYHRSNQCIGEPENRVAPLIRRSPSTCNSKVLKPEPNDVSEYVCHQKVLAIACNRRDLFGACPWIPLSL